MIITIGVDPGKRGGIAVLGNGSHILFTAATPVFRGIYMTTQMTNMLLPFAGHKPWEWAKTAQMALSDLTDTLSEDSDTVEGGQDEAYYDTAYERACSVLDTYEEQFKYEAIYCVIEKQRGRKGFGAETMIQAGRGWGIWLGLLCALGIPFEEIASGRWQKNVGVHGTGLEDKQKKAFHVEKANQLFPKANILKSQDGIADALLLAVYAYRRYMGGVLEDT